MTDEVVTVSPESSLKEVAEKMRDLNVGVIPVASADKPVGIVTDRDIVLRSVSENKEANSVKANDIMTKNLIFGTPDMSVLEAADIMSKHQIRRLPVVDSDKLVGIVSIGDLATEPQFSYEAAKALSDISEPSQPQI